MGLFSVLGKIAKGVASKLTGGASDIVLKGLGAAKSIIGGKPKPPVAATAHMPTIQARALLNKAIEHAPRVQRTEYVEGWSHGKARGGFKRKRAAKRKRRTYEEVMLAEGISQGYLPPGTTELPRKPRKARRSPAAPRSPRKAPSGGLDLKAIGAAWQKAGKGPGTGMTWSQFRAANSHLRVK